MVGDSEQSIYNFRGSTPEAVRGFTESLAQASRMDQNFRSTPAICSVIDSLRFSGASDRAAGAYKNLNMPVYVVPFQETTALFEEVTPVVAESGLTASEVVILAHKADVAANSSGRLSFDPGTNKISLLANSIHDVITGAQVGNTQIKVLRAMGRSLQAMNPDKGATKKMLDTFVESIGMNEKEYLLECLRLALAIGDPFSGTSEEFRTKLNAQTASQAKLQWTTKRLQTPRSKSWPLAAPGMGSERLEHSTIHKYKGLEKDGVVLVLPKSSSKSTGTKDWLNGEDSEARRVLYVGASRARKILILAVHRSHITRLTRRLATDGVQYELRDTGTNLK